MEKDLWDDMFDFFDEEYFEWYTLGTTQLKEPYQLLFENKSEQMLSSSFNGLT